MKKKKLDLSKPVTLRGLRKSAGLSQTQVAERIKIAQRTVSQYEAGDFFPSFDKACALAREYGVSLKTLAKAMQIDVTRIPDKDNIFN